MFDSILVDAAQALAVRPNVVTELDNIHLTLTKEIGSSPATCMFLAFRP